jgi:hypothetical protein
MRRREPNNHGRLHDPQLSDASYIRITATQDTARKPNPNKLEITSLCIKFMENYTGHRFSDDKLIPLRERRQLMPVS